MKTTDDIYIDDVDDFNSAEFGRDFILNIESLKANIIFLCVFAGIFLLTFINFRFLNIYFSLIGLYLIAFVISANIISTILRMRYGGQLSFILNLFKKYIAIGIFYLHHVNTFCIFLVLSVLRYIILEMDYVFILTTQFLYIKLFFNFYLRRDFLIEIIPATLLYFFICYFAFYKNLVLKHNVKIHWRIFIIISLYLAFNNFFKKFDTRNIMDQIMINKHNKQKSYSKSVYGTKFFLFFPLFLFFYFFSGIYNKNTRKEIKKKREKNRLNAYNEKEAKEIFEN